MRKSLAAALVLVVSVVFLGYAEEWTDDFDGALKPEWAWVREVPWNWSVNERIGWLRIMPQPGGLLYDANNARNLLIRDVPAGDYWIQTYLEFAPTEDYQIAGLLIYENDGNFLMLGRGCCDRRGGNKIYFDYEVGGMSPTSGELTTPSLDRAYVRIVKEGTKYSGYYKEEDTDWVLVSEWRTDDIRPIGIGLAAFEGSGAAAHADVDNADFAYFMVRETETETATAPKPPSMVPSEPSAAEKTETGAPPVGPVYASRVVECVKPTKHCDPDSILGPPCEASGAPRIDVIQNLLRWPGCWLGLQEKGYIVVEMEWPFTDGPGEDLLVYDFLADQEGGQVITDEFSIYVSTDGDEWVRVGSNVRARGGRPPIGYAAIDLAGNPGTYRFVKVAATQAFGAEPWDVDAHLGPELMAVEALYPAEL